MMITKTRSVEVEQRIGKYNVLEKVGAGGFGTVYRVYDPTLQLERALKIPFSRGESVDRALQESRNQAKIHHPAVVQVHSVDEIDGNWAIVMDYATGGSLRDKLVREGSLGIDESLRHIESLAHGLAAAHRQNILHYDLKPENILFDESGNALLADFGISRRMEQTGKKMSRIIGTVEYMGPEQLNGLEDKRSEVWSLGAVLYEMLSGEPCFKGESDSQVIANILGARFKPVRALNRSIPVDLDRIVRKMLALNPDERYQSMEEVMEALREFRDENVGETRHALMKLFFMFIFVAAFILGGGILYADRVEIFRLPWLQGLLEPEKVPVPTEVATFDPKQQFEAGKREIEKRNFLLAYQIFKGVDEKAKDTGVGAQAAFFKGSLALNYLNDPDLALRDFSAFLEKYPRSPLAGDVHYFLGGIYNEKRQNMIKAIEHLTMVIEKYPKSSHVNSAEFLLQDAAKVLAREGASSGLVVRSFIGGFLPNDWMPFLISILGLLSSIGMPIAWIMTQYHQPSISKITSVRGGFREMMKHKVVRKLVYIVIFSQILSFGLTQYQSHKDFSKSAGALAKVGVSLEKK